VNQVIKTNFNTTIIPTDSSGTMHVGGPLDPEGGTLRYNKKGFPLSNGERGPLHDPTALVYVPTDDLRKNIVTPLDRVNCRENRGGIRNLQCPVKLPNSHNFEPLNLRANAGSCVEITLRNRLPETTPDLASFVTQHFTVIRDRNSPQGVTTFNNNLIRASSHIGMHTQKLEYDISRDDGVNVGINPIQTVAPGGERTYRFYAGDLELEPRAGGNGSGAYGGLWGNQFNLIAKPVEYGGVNLQPADLIKQGQKGLFGLLTILPQGSTFVTDPGTTAQATVTLPNGDTFRDFSMVIQKAVNLRYKSGVPVENIAGEGFGVPEDAHDAGAAAINFTTEPLWFRYRYAAGTDWGNGGGHGLGLGAIPNMREAYSNSLVNGDPQTPVYLAEPGQQMRFRVGAPAGYARSTTLGIFGHNWAYEPFASVGMASDVMEWSPTHQFRSSQDLILPPMSYNILTQAGGPFSVRGDYLYRDLASFGNSNGLWGIVRVEEGAVPPPN
jgi:hypothetical protein